MVTSNSGWQWLEQYDHKKLLLVLVLLTFAIFSNTFGHQFVYDDHLLIEQNEALRDWSYVTNLFSNSHSYDVSFLSFENKSMDYYRPFTRLLFWLAYHTFSLDPFYWHLLCTLLFCAIVGLAFGIIKELTGRRSTAFLAVLLFAVHPIHSEVVAWINCLVELLHATFFLAGFLCYLYAKNKHSHYRKLWYGCAWIMALSALFSKETGLCFPLLVFIYEFVHLEAKFLSRIGQALLAASPFLLVVLVYITMRYLAYGGALRIGSTLPLSTIIYTIPRVVLQYLKLLVVPTGLSPLHSVPLVTSATSLWFWLLLLLFIASAIYVYFYQPPLVIFAYGWFFLTLMPTLNIGRFPADRTLQNRYTFLPSLAFCLLFVLVIEKLALARALRQQNIVLAGIAVIVITFSILTMRQNSTWQTDTTLWAHTISVQPNSDLAYSSYGWALFYENKQDEAAQYFTKSYQLSEGKSGTSCVGLANCYLNKNDFAQAINFYEQALKLGEGQNLLVYVNLGYCYYKQGYRQQALDLLNRTLTVYPKFEQARNMRDSMLNGTLE